MNLIFTNFLLALKNTSLVHKNSLLINFNKNFLPLLRILYEEGYVLSYIQAKEKLLIRFRYYNNINNLQNLKIVSKISRPVCLNKFDVFKISEKNKLLLFSTSKGLLTSVECKKLKLGGKFLFFC